jgi:Mce-associated membrane protein
VTGPAGRLRRRRSTAGSAAVGDQPMSDQKVADEPVAEPAVPEQAAEPATESADAAAADQRGSGTAAPRQRPSWPLFGVVAALAVLGLVTSAVLLFARPSDTELRDSALQAGQRYTATLTTYDARTLDEDVERVRRISTEQFAQQYAETIDGLRDTIQNGQTASVGSVVAVGVEEVEGDTATVLVAVNQEITDAGQPARVEANRVRMTLSRSGGSWFIDAVERL